MLPYQADFEEELQRWFEEEVLGEHSVAGSQIANTYCAPCSYLIYQRSLRFETQPPWLSTKVPMPFPIF